MYDFFVLMKNVHIIMNKKIAIPVDESGVLDAHFGHCKFFAFISVEDKNIISEEKVVPPAHEPGLLPVWLSEHGITDVIAGGMGQKAINLMLDKGINAFVGAQKTNTTELVNGFLNDSLSLSANYCNHGPDHECDNH